MNEWSIYIALYCVLLYTQSALQSCGGLSSTTTSVQHPLGWCDGSHRTTAPVRSPHTSYRWRGERDRAISGWGLLGGHDWQGPVEGIWPGHRGYTPTLYEKCHWIFNDHRESGPRFLTSHPKDGALFDSIVSPSLYWGVRTHRDHRVSTPCWPH